MSSEIVPSVCAHDCPSACALEVERLAPDRIGRVRGAKAHPYTCGVVCEKVGRYAERVHNPERLTRPLRRVGAKGEGRFEPIPWDEALDAVAEGLSRAAARHGPATVWPYKYGGTMGLVQRDGLARLTNLLGHSRQVGSLCTGIAFPGWQAGVGAMLGTPGTEVGEAELIVFWGTNPVHTQVQLMTHVQRARRARGAGLVVVDPYRTPSAAAADQHLMLRPGTDGALACAVMHVLLREGLADREYLARMTDFGPRTEQHLAARGPAWAAPITGLAVEEIESFARRYGATKRAFIRFGYGFTRQRNGAAAMHAASCLPAVTGAWAHRGGGGLFTYSGGFGVDVTPITAGERAPDPPPRALDMCRLGAILTGDREDLAEGPPVTAMLIQSCNPAATAPDAGRVRQGLLREDLFLCVHEQVLTDTARYADVLLPATTFLEHDDLYKAGGHSILQVARRVIEAPGEARENHEVVNALLARLGADHPSIARSAWQQVDAVLAASGWPDAETVLRAGGVDVASRNDHGAGGAFHGPPAGRGFGHPDGRFRFHPAWSALGPLGEALPDGPDHVANLELADETHPFRLVTAPARRFLNTTFSETPGSRAGEGRPTVKIHPDDADRLGVADGDAVIVGNARGELPLHAERFDGLQRGVLVAESIWPASAYPASAFPASAYPGPALGINVLVGGDSPPPSGGAAYHDSAVWLRRAE